VGLYATKKEGSALSPLDSDRQLLPNTSRQKGGFLEETQPDAEHVRDTKGNRYRAAIQWTILSCIPRSKRDTAIRRGHLKNPVVAKEIHRNWTVERSLSINLEDGGSVLGCVATVYAPKGYWPRLGD
jgi:hypothetical protein